MKNLPEKIYLQVGDDPGDNFSDLAEVTWSQDKIFDTDIEYSLGAIVITQDQITAAAKVVADMNAVIADLIIACEDVPGNKLMADKRDDAKATRLALLTALSALGLDNIILDESRKHP